MLDISFDDSECGCLKQAGINSCSNICCLDLMLDRGGIGEAEIFRERVKWKKIWYSSLLDIPAEEESEHETEWAFDCLDRAVDLAKSGEEIRIWHSDRAFSKCGLYYLAWRLDGVSSRVWSVDHIPDREVKAIKICADILTESKMWLDETFIGYRIRKMIETGRLAVRKESESDEPFPSWLRNIYVKKTV